ncbi:MAG: hypothetical protein PWP67_2040 [Clostridium butyricum]|nr:hypothetical protein [Clostridium butyricum]
MLKNHEICTFKNANAAPTIIDITAYLFTPLNFPFSL